MCPRIISFYNTNTNPPCAPDNFLLLPVLQAIYCFLFHVGYLSRQLAYPFSHTCHHYLRRYQSSTCSSPLSSAILLLWPLLLPRHWLPKPPVISFKPASPRHVKQFALLARIASVLPISVPAVAVNTTTVAWDAVASQPDADVRRR